MPEQLSMLPALDAALHVHDVAANVRASDPVTSFQAAREARAFASSQCDMIAAALRAHGPMSKDQLAARLRLDGVAIARRLADLQKAGRAVPTGETRPSVSGRSERVWRCV
jgi:predicted HTH transcriptional regulator